jgi:hypothetical protein
MNTASELLATEHLEGRIHQGRKWWTRTQSIRTAAALPFEPPARWDPQRIETQLAEIAVALDYLEELIGGDGHAVGASLTQADGALIPILLLVAEWLPIFRGSRSAGGAPAPARVLAGDREGSDRGAAARRVARRAAQVDGGWLSEPDPEVQPARRAATRTRTATPTPLPRPAQVRYPVRAQRPPADGRASRKQRT